MKRILVLLSFLLITFAFVGCETELTADASQAKATAQALDVANRGIGMPAIGNFQQKKTLKMIYELTDQENLICYAYLWNEMQGKAVYIGKCIGYGIPFSAQFTNPEKVIEGDKALGYDLSGYINYPMKLPQADPNGLFMPTSSSATWLIMVDPKTNKPRPVYFEPTIIVSPFPLDNLTRG